jgi:hypothetical protein
MNNESKKNILFLENFFKKNKENTLKIMQPTHIDFDIFKEDEEEKLEEAKRNASQKLRSANTFGVIQKNYSIAKESTIFEELDSKKSFNILKDLQQRYKKNLFNTIIRNRSLNNQKFNSARNDNYNFIRKKSSVNLSEQYEIKLKNVRKIKIIQIYILSIE